ncbi:MAG: DNA helicase IV [Candidatus Poriferisodalaceae bacterium]
MTSPDAEILQQREHQHHLEARAHLETMKARAEHIADYAAADAASANTSVDAQIISAHMQHRAASFNDHPDGLFFGAINNGEDNWYVGRRHIEDSDGAPFVVDWRTPVAAPFYRATVANPLELQIRLRHSIEDHEVVAVFHEDFDDPDSVGGGGVPDPLLAQLERGRSGQMRDIVATIQAEQDLVIRAPLDDLVIVQGGPGTGKTAVGLHRAAFLLFEHRERLVREQVLVVGPNQLFLRYISQVLPSLGENAVHQTTLEGLVAPRLRARATEDDPTASLKGDERMIGVAARLVDDAIGADGIEAPVGRFIIRFSAEDIAEAITSVRATTEARNVGRTGFQRQLIARWIERRLERHPDERPEIDRLRSHLIGDKILSAALDKAWPNQSAVALLRRLYSSPSARQRVTSDILTVEEAGRLKRSVAKKASEEQWTQADLALLDELEHRLNGTQRNFGHIIVDEAQDLSALGFRAIARRCPNQSMTILGDLAQATAPASQVNWTDALRHLDAPETARVEELELGYRLPAALLEAASVLLPAAAPHVTPSRSVRQGGQPPAHHRRPSDELARTAADKACELAAAHSTIGVVTTPTHHEAVVELLRELGAAQNIEVGVGMAGLAGQIVIVQHDQVKGLEFDAVVLVEPARFVDLDTLTDRRGLRLLYVAMTRAVHSLDIVHHDALPAPL